MKRLLMVMIFSLSFLVGWGEVRAGGIIYNNCVVYEGATKGEVAHKFGSPVYVSPGRYYIGEGSRTEETWTYVIEGCYREFEFEGNTLIDIKHGSLAE